MGKSSLSALIALTALCGFAVYGYADTAAAPAAVTTANSVAASAEMVNSTEGTIASMDVQSAAPWIKVSSNGSVMTIQLDAKSTTVWKAGKAMTLADLKAGDKVTVRHTAKNGKEVAKSIEIV